MIHLRSFSLSLSLSAVPAPTVVANIVDGGRLGNPITITCTVQFTFELWSDTEVQISWSKDSLQLHKTTHMQVTDVAQVNGTSSYQSNVTMSSAREEDSGVYVCTARVLLPHLSNHPITITGYSATFLSLQRELTPLD